jgi:hypothetical protein
MPDGLCVRLSRSLLHPRPHSTSPPMAEVTVGLLSAAATVGAAHITAASNFTGRHESSHREVIMERRRNTDEFFASLRGGDVTPDEETEFLRTRTECVPRLQTQSLRLTRHVTGPFSGRTNTTKALRATKQFHGSISHRNLKRGRMLEGGNG